jgi:hypothetical protein
VVMSKFSRDLEGTLHSITPQSEDRP